MIAEPRNWHLRLEPGSHLTDFSLNILIRVIQLKSFFLLAKNQFDLSHFDLLRFYKVKPYPLPRFLIDAELDFPVGSLPQFFAYFEPEKWGVFVWGQVII